MSSKIQKKINLRYIITCIFLLVCTGDPCIGLNWEAKNTILCETILIQIEYRDIAKTVLCETLLHTMRGIEIFQKPPYREISPMRDRPMWGPPVLGILSYIQEIINIHYIKLQFNRSIITNYLLLITVALSRILAFFPFV